MTAGDRAAAARIAMLEHQLARADRIIEALVERVEGATDFRATDSDGTNYRNAAFSVFETAVAWDSRVRARTADQARALTQLSQTLAELAAAKAATEEAQRRLGDAIESINEGFAIFDAQDRLVLCNHTYLGLWPGIADRMRPGLAYADLLKMIGAAGTSLQTSVAPGRWISERLQQRGEAPAAHVHALADGRWIQVDELRTSEGGIVVVCTDITKVKVEDAHERARELAEKSALLQATLDTIHSGVCVYDCDRRLTAWNARWLAMTGLTEEGVESVSTHQKLLARCLGDSSGQETSPLSWPLADAPADVGQWEPASGRIIEVRRALMPDGGVTMSFDDVTYRVQAATALQELNESLELRVQARTADLEAVNAQLQREVGERVAAEAALLEAKQAAEQHNVEKTRFLAAVSHDLVQPLNAARLFVTALSNHALPPASAPLVQQASSALDSVEEILEALLEISQLDAGAIRPAIETIDLDALLQSLMTEFKPFAAQRGLTLSMTSDNRWVRSDARLLRRMLQNLISNALRYTEAGGVRVITQRRGDKILVKVQDTGPGIARKDREVIFKEFSRLKTSGRSVGAGLGLAIVDRAARMLQHPIALRSRLGVGSTFSLALPQGEPPTAAAPHGASEMQGPLQGRVVLAIDNEASSLDALAALVGGWGCRVVTARDERATLFALEQSGAAPDVIVADYHLDDGELGDAVVRRLRARIGGSTPAIIVTADRETALRRRLADQGLHVLTKPIKPGQLRTLLQHLFSLSVGAVEPTPPA